MYGVTQGGKGGGPGGNAGGQPGGLGTGWVDNRLVDSAVQPQRNNKICVVWGGGGGDIP